MKLLLLGICLALVSSLASAMSNSEWASYKRQYGKSYIGNRDAIHEFNLVDTKLKVSEHNAKYAEQRGFTMGLNHMSDWSSEERAKLLAPMNREVLDIPKPTNTVEIKDIVPDLVDWSLAPNRVSEVQDQGACASGWAFATTGVLEGQQNTDLNSDQLIKLSEQNLIDCTASNKGCSGGTMENAFSEIMARGGIETEVNYPYLAHDGQCRFNKSQVAMSIDGFTALTRGDEYKLKIWVANQGPTATGMNVEEDFFSFKSGVYYNPNCSSGKINHAVLIVGYGTDPKYGDYWLVKNSWGSDWGEKGYFKIARNRNNHCGIASMPIFPHFKDH